MEARQLPLSVLLSLVIVLPTWQAVAENCYKDLTPFTEQISALEGQIPKLGAGGLIESGKCTLRAMKIGGITIGLKKDFANMVPIQNAIDCLLLQKHFTYKACECRARGLSYSGDEHLSDSLAGSYKKVVAAEAKVRAKALKSYPTIKDFVDKAAKQRDCISVKALQEMDEALAMLNAVLDECDASNSSCATGSLEEISAPIGAASITNGDDCESIMKSYVVAAKRNDGAESLRHYQNLEKSCPEVVTAIREETGAALPERKDALQKFPSRQVGSLTQGVMVGCLDQSDTCKSEADALAQGTTGSAQTALFMRSVNFGVALASVVDSSLKIRAAVKESRKKQSVSSPTVVVAPTSNGNGGGTTTYAPPKPEETYSGHCPPGVPGGPGWCAAY